MNMKKMSVLLLVFVLAFSNASILWSQTTAKMDDPVNNILCCNEKMHFNIPDLTDDQKKKINNLQKNHLKEVNQTKALLNEKQAHLRTLQLADKPDNAAINKTIDEITALRNDMMKKHEAYRQAVRSLLTDNQKVVFDARGCCSKQSGTGCQGKCGDNCKGKISDNQELKGRGCCHRN